MSVVKVDLRQLAVDRNKTAPEPSLPTARRQQMLSRLVLPALLLAGFVALVVHAVRDTVSPPRSVTVVPVISSQADMRQAADTPLFRAAGWVEPRPTPSVVTALAEGVVEKLLVLEGQEVKAGDVVAHLVAADARLALDAADADMKLREGELAGATAGLKGATARLDQPIHLRTDLAEADAVLAKAEMEFANLPFQIRAAESRLRFASSDLENKEKLAGAVPEIQVSKSRSDVEVATASVEEMQSRGKRLPTEIAALRERRDTLRQRLQRKTDEVRQAAESGALVQTAQARLKQAEVARDVARLRLERMEIRAPASGKVLSLVARPGMRLSGLNPGSLIDSSTVVTLYDPAKLQVRVDVRLDDVGKVQSGQKARIESAAVPGKTLEGEVLMATSQADIQKNTLSIKVAVVDPPTSLKPDMLCQVTFLAPPRPAETGGEEGEAYRLLVPRQLVDGAGDAARVWVADRLTGTASLRAIKTGQGAGELVEVLSGLSSSDKLIVGGRDGLKDGERVTVTAEDDSLGITTPGGQPKAKH